MELDSIMPLSDLSALALFVDVDGTLLEIAATPQAVEVGPRVLPLLSTLSEKTGGALALVSGRAITALDKMFAPLVLPCAGLHGFERRDLLGTYHRCAPPKDSLLQTARESLQRLTSLHSGLLIEDKRFSLALHYRRAPDVAGSILRAMHEIASGLRPELTLQLGKMVAELRPAGANKGAAVRAFLQQAPFRGRYPVYIGDDLTDESAFECVNEAGGISIAVNVRRPTAAWAALPDVSSVLDWLQGLPASLEDLDAWTEVSRHTYRFGPQPLVD